MITLSIRIREGPQVKIDVMGVQFDNVTMDEAVEQARGILDGGAAHYCVTPNPEIVY